MSTEISNVNQNTQNTCKGKCPDTLCWNCRYATGSKFETPRTIKNNKTGATRRIERCPWADACKPVPGWKAEKTVIKNPEIYGDKVDSYVVFECPCFKEDERKEITIEEIILEFNFPVRYALSNRLILWDYYDVYQILKTDAQKTYGLELTSEQSLRVKIASIRGYLEDLNFDLKDEYITQEEFDQKLDLVEILEETIKKCHDKPKKNSK